MSFCNLVMLGFSMIAVSVLCGQSSQRSLWASGLNPERPVEARLSKLEALRVNLLDFGAVPDDGNDDTDAIQQAIDHGGTIIIPSGVYNVDGFLSTGGQSVDMRGKPGAVFQGKGDLSRWTVDGDIESFRITGLTFKNFERALNGFNFTTDRISIEQCHFSNCAMAIRLVQGEVRSGSIQNNTFRDLHSLGVSPQVVGIGIGNDNVEDYVSSLRIEGNRFYDLTGDANVNEVHAIINYAAHVVISNNVVEGLVHTVDGLPDSTPESSGGEAIYNKGNFVNIKHNSVIDASHNEAAIANKGGRQVRIIGNVIIDERPYHKVDGILFTPGTQNIEAGMDHGVIMGNRIVTPGDAAVVFGKGSVNFIGNDIIRPQGQKSIVMHVKPSWTVHEHRIEDNRIIEPDIGGHTAILGYGGGTVEKLTIKNNIVRGGGSPIPVDIADLSSLPGSVVHLPAGNYEFPESITIPPGVRFTGDGPGRTVLVADYTPNTGSAFLNLGADAELADISIIEEQTSDPTTSPPHNWRGVQVGDGNSLENVHVAGFTHGISARRTVGFRATDCLVEHSYGWGWDLVHSRDFILTRCTGRSNGLDGFKIINWQQTSEDWIGAPLWRDGEYFEEDFYRQYGLDVYVSNSSGTTGQSPDASWDFVRTLTQEESDWRTGSWILRDCIGHHNGQRDSDVFGGPENTNGNGVDLYRGGTDGLIEGGRWFQNAGAGLVLHKQNGQYWRGGNVSIIGAEVADNLGSGGHGILVSHSAGGAGDFVIKGCYIHGNSQSGIQCNAGPSGVPPDPIDGLIIADCTNNDNGERALKITGTSGLVLSGNNEFNNTKVNLLENNP